MASAKAIVNTFFPRVKKVSDADSDAFVEVTKAHTQSARVKNHNECALAVACKRTFKLDGVIISRSTAYLVKGTHARRFHLPASVSREVVSFDRGAGFAEGKYELHRPAKNARIGAMKGSKKKVTMERLIMAA